MSWGPLLVNLAVTAGTVAALMLATFAYAMRTRVHAIMDTIWPLGFVTVAAVSFGLSAGPGLAARRVMWFVSLPLQVAMYERAGLSAVPWLGVAVWRWGSASRRWVMRRHTGKKLLEKHMARSKGTAYADYVRRTSGFIPWPPKFPAPR